MAHNVDYHEHNGFWLPEDLAVGDIVTVNIHKRNNKGSFVQKGVILGMSVNPNDPYDEDDLDISDDNPLGRFDVTGLYVAPIKPSSANQSEDNAFFIDPDMIKNQDVIGVDKSIIPTDHVLYFPITSKHVPYFNVPRLGRFSEETLSELRSAINRNNHGQPVEIKHLAAPLPGNVITCEPSNCDVPVENEVVGLEYTKFDDDFNAQFPELYGQEFDFTKAYKFDYAMRLRHPLDGNTVEKFIRGLDFQVRDTMRAFHKAAQLRKSFISRFTAEDSRANRSGYAADLLNKARELVEQDKAEEELNPTKTQRCEAVLELLEEIQTGRKKTALEQQQDENDYNRSVVLPSHLWRGRYISVNWPDLTKARIDNAFRPCIVWKAYGVEEDGEEVIKALEVIPVDRDVSHRFNSKIRVNPLYTKSNRPGFLLCAARAIIPVNARVIQDSTNTTFYELNSDKLAKVEAKVQYLESVDASILTTNLCPLREEWKEIALDPAPTHKQMLKWRDRGFIQIDDNKGRHDQGYKDLVNDGMTGGDASNSQLVKADIAYARAQGEHVDRAFVKASRDKVSTLGGSPARKKRMRSKAAKFQKQPV